MMRVSSASRLMTSGGVPAGARNICEVSTTALGTPASAMVGTSGRSSSRLSAVTARARNCPPFTIGVAGGGSAMVSADCSPMTLTSDSLLLL